MTRYTVSADTVSDSGLNFRSAPAVSPDNLIGLLMGGDVVESTGTPQNALPIMWLPVRVLVSSSFAPGTTGYVARSVDGEIYLVETGSQTPSGPTGVIQALSQRDSRWKSQALGFSGSCTIGTDGCTLTCLTMVSNLYGFGETPATLNARLKALGSGIGFIDALMVWAGLIKALPGMKLNGFVLCRDTPAPMERIDAALTAGKPVVVEVDQSAVPGLQHHWVVLSKKTDGDYLIFDPWPVPTEAGGASLTGRYGFRGALDRIITAAVFYDGPGHTPVLPPPSFFVTVGSHPDVVAAGGLALRDAPVNGAIIARLLPGSLLSVLELPDAASAKIGQAGQWLNVRDDQNRAGYVAAWYVQAQRAARPRARKLGEMDVQPTLRTPMTHQPKLVVIVHGRTKIPAQGTVLRASPPLGKELGRLKAGTKLTVAESARTAQAKIGARGKWIKVRDANGLVGYVAALYVHL